MPKTICKKCGYGKKPGEWKRRSKLWIARCPRCGGYQTTKKMKDRRYKRNRNKATQTPAPTSPETQTST